MNKRISLGIAISLVAIGCAITFVLTWTVSLSIYNRKISSSEKYEGVYQKLQEMDVTVRNNYTGTIVDETLEASVINGYVSGIGDKYATYMPAQTYYELRQTSSGVVNGAGFEAEADGSGYLRITNVYKGGSAENNGVIVGDIITEIDGRSLLGMGEDVALDRISGGDIGTKLTLRLVRSGEELTVNLIRQQIDISSVTDEMLDDNIGYIRITSFNAKTPEQFSNSLNSLSADGAKALIIDLRQNGGGVISALKPMLNRILPAAVIATAEYAGGVKKTLIETDSEEQMDLPIAVLVDGGTASAAELFAVALRDEHGAMLIGTQTYGKAVMQSTYEFQDGSALSLTTATILPSKSQPYDGVGLKPDYVTELPSGASIEYLPHETDSQLQKAVEILAPQANPQQ
ncbi:MAG: S41 family peptidase [Lachnospiraceae bacterium]|nr:S41 family peptidase [Ruminococcus sp.]MCM1275153.1 S41 family peptidase [Lachnospiraceae bacterium]